MCGIFFIVNSIDNAAEFPDIRESLEWIQCKDVIKARGPDSVNNLQKKLTERWYGHFHASVLWMQGPKPVTQPLLDANSNILLWNGDVFCGKMFKENVCDSEIVLENLENSSDIQSTLRDINGPFSIIYYQESSKQLFFGRDRFGRHSLLIKVNKELDSLLLTSTADKNIGNIVEVPAIGIFAVDFSRTKINLKCFPWKKPDERLINILNGFKMKLGIHVDISEGHYLQKLEELSLSTLLNTKSGFLKYAGNINDSKNFDEVMSFFLAKEEICDTVNNLHRLLSESVRRRVKAIPKFCKNCTVQSSETTLPCQHAKVGILFSGGLDSAILAALAHNNVDVNEEIDLINVAFEKKKNNNYEVPDRITGRQTFNELLKICDKRRFNFIEVDVPHEELAKHRSTRISNLVYPHATVLDDSLACAVWFASRAKGTLYPTKQPYESTCRVLLLGMGADEQFGGYMRHRTILKREGWQALAQELKLEFDRISERNLGRDDRMVADHGRQSRLPYLDEDLVDFVQKLPPSERCCPIENFPPGLGDKLLLRLLARIIGLYGAAKFPKRAFQFGSRIADGKENAKDISKRL